MKEERSFWSLAYGGSLTGEAATTVNHIAALGNMNFLQLSPVSFLPDLISDRVSPLCSVSSTCFSGHFASTPVVDFS